MPLWPLLALMLAPRADAAEFSSCSRAFDRDIEIVLPAAVHARLSMLTGPHARSAAAFLLSHPTHTLAIGVDVALADGQPSLPLMAGNSLMQFMPGRGYMLEHGVLHEIAGGERGLARRPADMKAFADMLLPIWVHEISHGRIRERPVRWPVTATLENELIASFTQAVFTAEMLSAEPGFAGLRAVYRAQRAAAAGQEAAVLAYRALSPTKRMIVKTLEAGASSTEDFERIYRSAYSAKSSLADPLTAGLRMSENSAELVRLLSKLKDPPSRQTASADEMISYGRQDEAFWLDPAAPAAASRDAEGQLGKLRAELDAARPALRAWFADTAGEPVDWTKITPPRDVPIAVAPSERRR